MVFQKIPIFTYILSSYVLYLNASLRLLLPMEKTIVLARSNTPKDFASLSLCVYFRIWHYFSVLFNFKLILHQAKLHFSLLKPLKWDIGCDFWRNKFSSIPFCIDEYSFGLVGLWNSKYRNENTSTNIYLICRLYE